MRFSLAAQFRRARNPRRKAVTLRQIVAPATLATDLYRGCYAPIITAWQNALPAILAEYGRALATMTADSPSDVSAQIGKVGRDSVVLFIGIRAKLERWAARIEAWQRSKWRANVLSATSVDLATMIGPGEVRQTLEATIQENVALVSSVSEQAKQRIEGAVFRGLRERRSAEDVGRDIRAAVDMGRRRAKNIAADQTVKIAAALNEERRRRAGIDTFEWIHSEKLHPRPAHLARNHALFTENGERVGSEYDGKRVNAAPAASDMPGVPINCGCTSRAVLILD